MDISVLTLFPEMFDGIFNASILKKAREKGVFSYNIINFRNYSEQKNQQVDDYPFGGGAGMVLQAQPLFDAVRAVKERVNGKVHVVMMCPQGEVFSQEKAEKLAGEEHLVFICGHYEGYDERIRQYLVDEIISIGDYILTGGEVASMVVIDSVVRLLPGVLGNQDSITSDSHSSGLLSYPQYTRPANFRGLGVPKILLSGHHKHIDEWRYKEAFKNTYLHRPDLLMKRQLTKEENGWIKTWSEK